jgi:hypothetical protein
MITASSKSPRAGSPVREKAMAPQLFGSLAMLEGSFKLIYKRK